MSSCYSPPEPTLYKEYQPTTLARRLGLAWDCRLQTAFKQTDYHNAANLVRQGRFLNKLRQEIQAAQ